MNKSSTKQVGNNPKGIGGFGDNPQHRNDGRWKKEDSISYQYNKLIRLTQEEMNNWLEDNPESKRTVAQDLAFGAVIKAKRDFKYLTEITDRTEGKSIWHLVQS